MPSHLPISSTNSITAPSYRHDVEGVHQPLGAPGGLWPHRKSLKVDNKHLHKLINSQLDFKDPLPLIRDSFNLRTLMLFGAVAQAALVALLPKKLAFLPTALLATHSILSTLIQSIRSKNNPYMKGVVRGPVTAQFPDRATGLFGYDPAAESVVVFHFGNRFNHPLGLACPGGAKAAEYFFSCAESVQEKADDYGLLGLTRWQSADRDNHTTMMVCFYFRDVEGLHKFAHDKAHFNAATWASRHAPEHIGFFHETFQVPRKSYETIYRNMPPTLLGQARVKCNMVADGKEKWVSTLVSAADKPLMTLHGRMGTAVTEEDQEVEW